MRQIKIFVLIFFAFFGMMTTVLPATAFAANCTNNSSSILGLPTWYKYLKLVPSDGGGCSVELPTQNNCDRTAADCQINWGESVSHIGLALIEILLRIGALVAVGYIIYGGYRYILSQGEPDSIKKAQGTIVNSVIGLVITIFATAIVNLIGGVLLR